MPLRWVLCKAYAFTNDLWAMYCPNPPPPKPRIRMAQDRGSLLGDAPFHHRPPSDVLPHRPHPGKIQDGDVSPLQKIRINQECRS